MNVRVEFQVAVMRWFYGIREQTIWPLGERMDVDLRKVACIAISIIFISCHALADGLEGDYSITSATLPNGKTYSGKVRITKVGKSYSVEWATSAGKYQGVAIRVGDVLAVGWGGRGTGVVAYMRDKNSLKGLWTSGLTGQLGTETLQGKSKSWSGTWTVAGTNPGGNGRYEGSVSISPNNPHTIRWKVGNTYSGVGLDGHGVLAVGWGRGDVGVVHYKISGNKLLGRWAIPGSSGVGTENLKRQPSKK